MVSSKVDGARDVNPAGVSKCGVRGEILTDRQTQRLPFKKEYAHRLVNFFLQNIFDVKQIYFCHFSSQNASHALVS